MNVYRITKAEHIKILLSGSSAGGRWNLRGVPVIYTAETRALAYVEYLVHVPASIAPKNLKIVTIEIPDDRVPREVSISELPKNWRSYNPPPLELAELGTNWVKKRETLLLRVPSAVVEHEYNIIINPLHPYIRHIAVKRVENFTYDDRLIKVVK